MRDLTARLREIVRREDAGDASTRARPEAATGELTYTADFGSDRPLASLASDIGGQCLDGGGACVSVDRRYDAYMSHGRRCIESYVPDAKAPIELFDPRVRSAADWWRRTVFFDIETTGLSGGAGTIAFLVGCGWFEPDGAFLVRQFFVTGPSGERPMLDALARVFDDASLIVSYNGRTFDVPFMETRWAFHRLQTPTDDLPHFDMLPPARRLWGRRDLGRPDGEGCSLSALERRVLGFHRLDDVPGFEIPGRYFHFLRTGDASVIEGVLEHNRHDLVSLAAVMSHALWMVREGPEACREPSEQLAIGQIYERAGFDDRAMEAYAVAAETGDISVRQPAWARLAAMHHRARRYAQAAEAWQCVLDLAPKSRWMPTPLERRAAEALAIHHEHRVRDLELAKGYAETLRASASGRRKMDVEHRVKRLDRKMDARGMGQDAALWRDVDEP